MYLVAVFTQLSCLYLKLNKFAWYVEQQQPKININIVLPPESETTKISFTLFFGICGEIIHQ